MTLAEVRKKSSCGVRVLTRWTSWQCFKNFVKRLGGWEGSATILQAQGLQILEGLQVETDHLLHGLNDTLPLDLGGDEDGMP